MNIAYRKGEDNYGENGMTVQEDSIFCFCKIEYNARTYKFKTFALP